MTLPGIETHGLGCVAFDPQSRWLIAGGGTIEGRELMAWNLPECDVRWHVVEKSNDALSCLAVRPGVAELATKSAGDIIVWSAAGRPLRKVKNDFLAGPIAYSPDGKRYISPAENSVKVRDSDTGKIVTTVPISLSEYTSAEAVAFVPGATQIVVAASVINNKGHISGKLMLVDLKQKSVLKSSKLDINPSLVAVDPHGRWACTAGDYRNRGHIVFWDLAKWRQVDDQGAHGASIDGLVVSPDGAQIATTGTDNIIRIWDASNCKTVDRLDQHQAKGKSSAGVAWSPNGRYLALACGGSPPWGGVFLYERSGEQWKLTGQSPAKTSKVAKPVEEISAQQPVEQPVATSPAGTAKWLGAYIRKNAAKKPLATEQTLAAWEKKHKIKLPRTYAAFVTTVGKHSFDDMFGMEGYAVRIVGPGGLDAIEYRRDEPEDPADDAEPDGLMFAVAVNGDCLCFDLRGRAGNYPVYHFNHEETTFQPFAANFAAAVKRLVDRE